MHSSIRAPAPARETERPLILASASPRRREILGWMGIAFEVVPAAVDEVADGDPELAVLVNARRKAEAVAHQSEGRRVLGVDTDVVCDERILGKAADRGQARDHLRLLSGRTHRVLSAVSLLTPGGPGREGLAETAVRFRSLDEATIELYLASGEWADRAGAYAIQGLGSMLIDRVEGDFSNVMGLPIPLLAELAPELMPPPAAS